MRIVIFLQAMFLSISLTFPAHAGLDDQLANLNWNVGPSSASIAGNASISFGEDYASLGVNDTNKFLELLGNLPSSEQRYAVVKSDLSWFVVLRYEDSGYIKDDEKIDADALLTALKKGNIEGNKERKKLGIPTLDLIGWSVPPFYNKQTNRLEWGTKLQDQDGGITINYTSRLLGRHGYVSATLVGSPDNFSSEQAGFNNLLTDFAFASGQKYAEFRSGDKVAEYGLAALVAGGAAAAVVKSKGLWKLIAGGAVAGLAFVWGAIKRLFRRA
jgi:uncharacterized membrane-anchored protein